MIIQANKISQFQLSGSFSDNQLFIKSEKNLSQYYSYKITGDKIFSAFRNTISKHDFHFTGNWMIKGRCTNAPENISLDDKNSAVTVKWCNDNLLGKLEEIRSQLFNLSNDKLKIPSYVGQVIISNSLNTEEKVKKIYGGSKWIQIKGRFLLGTGPNERNTDNVTYGSCSSGEINISAAKKAGGANKTILQIKNVPGHTHAVSDCRFGTLPEAEVSLRPGIETEAMFGFINVEVHHTAHAKHHGWSSGGGQTHDKGPYANVNSLISIGELLGSGDIQKSFSFTPKAESVSESCGSGDSTAGHNNMPPYIGEYIWERTA